MKKPKTHVELFALFLESVHELTNDIESVNASLVERGDDEELTQYHNTKRLIQQWFNRNGNMSI